MTPTRLVLQLDTDQFDFCSCCPSLVVTEKGNGVKYCGTAIWVPLTHSTSLGPCNYSPGTNSTPLPSPLTKWVPKLLAKENFYLLMLIYITPLNRTDPPED